MLLPDVMQNILGVGGTVKEVQMFHTVLGTVDNKVIYIPNGSLSSGVVTNFSNQTTRRVCCSHRDLRP